MDQKTCVDWIDEIVYKQLVKMNCINMMFCNNNIGIELDHPYKTFWVCPKQEVQ